MQQHDEVVSGWLNGSDSVDGLDNPAGPLYIDNADQSVANASVRGFTTEGGTTASCRPSSCHCC